MLMEITVWWACRANSSGMTFRFRWLNAQRDGVFLLFRPFTGWGGRCPAPDVVRVDERGGLGEVRWYKRQERAEQGEEGRANWMSEAQSCGLHLSFGSARNVSPLLGPPCASLSFALSPFFLARFRSFSFSTHFTWNLSLNSAVAPLRMDVG